MRLVDAMDGMSTSGSRRPQQPAAVLIAAARSPVRREQKPIADRETFMVRVRAVLEAQDENDRDCLRGELAELAAECERWADLLLESRTSCANVFAPDREVANAY